MKRKFYRIMFTVFLATFITFTALIVFGILVQPKQYSLRIIYNDYEDVIKYEERTTLHPKAIDGYEFDGYYLDQYFANPYESNEVEGALTLYAKYRVLEYTITYNLNGGASTSAFVYHYNVESSNITLNNNITKSNAVFLGWYKDYVDENNLGSRIQTINKGTIGNISLFARYSTNYLVNYPVRHHIQNLNDPGYSLYLEETFQALVSTYIDPSALNIEHFTYESHTSGLVSEGGFDVYYTRDSYNVTFHFDDVTFTTIIAYEGSITLSDYDFTPYLNGRELASFSGSLSNVSSDRDLYAIFEVVIVEYTISISFEGIAGSNDYTYTGVKGTLAVYSIANNPGYITPAFQSVILEDNTVIELYYAKNNYRVVLLDYDGSVLEILFLPYLANVVANLPEIDPIVGYTNEGFDLTGVPEYISYNLELVFVRTPQEVSYTIEVYVDGLLYTTYTLSALADSYIVAPNLLGGYELVSPLQTYQVTPDGSLVIEIYYVTIGGSYE